MSIYRTDRDKLILKNCLNNFTKKSHLNNFNKKLEEFIRNIATTFPTMKSDIDEIYKFPTDTDFYLLEFLMQIDNMGFDILIKNVSIFYENNRIIHGVDFWKIFNNAPDIWSDVDFEESTLDYYWKNLQVLYLHAFLYKKNLDIKDIRNKYKNLELDSPELVIMMMLIMQPVLGII